MYTDKVMEHFTNPKNVGEIKNPDGVGEVGNVKCGDIMKIFLKIDDDVITDVKFKTFGCGSAIASSSIATVMIKGKKVEDALKFTNKDFIAELGGLPTVKIHCSVLAEQAFKMAIYNYCEKTGKTYEGLKGFDPIAEPSHDDDIEEE